MDEVDEVSTKVARVKYKSIQKLKGLAISLILHRAMIAMIVDLENQPFLKIIFLLQRSFGSSRCLAFSEPLNGEAGKCHHPGVLSIGKGYCGSQN